MSTAEHPVNAVRFEQGLTFAQYMDRVAVNKEDFLARYEVVEISPEDRAFFAEVAQSRGGLKILALAEDWCGDVVANLPVMARIAETSPDIELRIFPRDDNLDIMDQYLNHGEFRSIPVFVFFDPAFDELGRWVERPAAASQLLADLKAEQLRLNVPDDVARLERRREMARAYGERLFQETVREIREVLS